MSTEFARYLASQLPKFGNRRRMAMAIGISPTRLSRALNVGDYPLDIRNCLQLALAAEVPAGEVLRKAGKADIADLIERLYGSGRDALTESQRTLLALWDGIDDPQMREAVMYTMRKLSKAAPGTDPKGSSRERAGTRAAKRGGPRTPRR